MQHIFTLCFLFGSLCVSAQITIPNAGFEVRGESTTGALGWEKGGHLDACTVDDVAFKGKHAIKLVRNEGSGLGVVHQEMPFQSAGLKKYILTCAVKTEGITGNAGVGARVFDKDGNTITGYTTINVAADQDWKVMEGEFYSDEGAAKLKVFANIVGQGTVWFDEISIREIPLSNEPISKEGIEYANEYFNYVYKFSVVRDTPFLDKLKANTFRLFSGHNDSQYFQGVLKRYTSLKLNDGHSFFWTTEEWKSYREGSKRVADEGLVNYVTGHMTSDGAAYLSIPAFASLDSNIIHQYVDSAQSIIKMLDEQKPKGWILDVSKNQGGNSFAMLAALGPLLGNGICGYSQSADGSKRTRVYNNGYVGWFPDMEKIQSSPVYQLKNKDLPIAVIYGGKTGSAGEVVAVSFRGKSGTKSFGTPTSGATTRVDNLEMSDGAVLNLACGWDADRTGHVYKTSVPPDVPKENEAEALAAATKWIKNYRK